IHARFKRDARTCRRLLEHHRQRSIAQRLIKLVTLEALLYPTRALEEPEEFIEREILELQEMLRTRRHRGRTYRTGPEHRKTKMLARERSRVRDDFLCVRPRTSSAKVVSDPTSLPRKKGAVSGALSTGPAVCSAVRP